jgi:hypothetical protein
LVIWSIIIESILKFKNRAELSSAITSLTKNDGINEFKWVDNSFARDVAWAPGQPADEGKCGAFGGQGMSMQSCKATSNFACEDSPYGPLVLTNFKPCSFQSFLRDKRRPISEGIS